MEGKSQIVIGKKTESVAITIVNTTETEMSTIGREETTRPTTRDGNTNGRDTVITIVKVQRREWWMKKKTVHPMRRQTR